MYMSAKKRRPQSKPNAEPAKRQRGTVKGIENRVGKRTPAESMATKSINLIKLAKRLRGNAFIFLGIFIVIALTGGLIYASTNKNAYAIEIDGNKVATVKKTGKLDVKEIESQAVLKIKNSLGTDILVNEKISFVPVHASKKEISSPDEAIMKVSNSLTYKVEACKIVVGQTDMAILKNKGEADKVLDSLMEPYRREGTNIIEEGFVEDVKTENVYVSSDEIITVEKALQILTTTSEAAETYTIVANDTLTKIAQKAGMTMEELLKVNPGYNINSSLRIGEEMVLTIDKPIVSVRTVEENKYKEVEPKPVQTLNNPNQPKSYRKSVQYGSDGEAEVTEHIIRINGIESEKTAVDRVIITEPVPEIIEVGTK